MSDDVSIFDSERYEFSASKINLESSNNIHVYLYSFQVMVTLSKQVVL